MQKSERMRIILGAIIRQHRNSAGLSQDDLAAALGVDRRHIGRYESGEKTISIARLFQLSYALKISPGRLLDELEEKMNYESLC